MKLAVGQAVSGSYDNGIESIRFSGEITEIRRDSAGGGFETARIKVSAGCRFSWEKEDRTALLCQTVGHKSVDNRFSFGEAS